MFFCVKTRQELNEWVVRHALSSRAEPLPEYGREGMVAIREFYRKLADDEGTVQFYANHPSKYHSFSKKIAPCLILESIFKHGSILKNINLSARIFGSGFTFSSFSEPDYRNGTCSVLLPIFFKKSSFC